VGAIRRLIRHREQAGDGEAALDLSLPGRDRRSVWRSLARRSDSPAPGRRAKRGRAGPVPGDGANLAGGTGRGGPRRRAGAYPARPHRQYRNRQHAPPEPAPVPSRQQSRRRACRRRSRAFSDGTIR
jgi:hypothetical protein